MTWCKEQIEETREALTNIMQSPLKDMPAICMKNDDGRFGTILRDDINNNICVVLDAYHNSDQYCYDDVEAMVQAGWVVD